MLGLLKYRGMDRRWQGKDQVFWVFYDAEARGCTSTYFFVLACTWRGVSVHNSCVRLRGILWRLPKIHLWSEILSPRVNRNEIFIFVSQQTWNFHSSHKTSTRYCGVRTDGGTVYVMSMFPWLRQPATYSSTTYLTQVSIFLCNFKLIFPTDKKKLLSTRTNDPDWQLQS